MSAAGRGCCLAVLALLLAMPASAAPAPAAAALVLSGRAQQHAYAIGYSYGEKLRPQRSTILFDFLVEGLYDVRLRKALLYGDRERQSAVAAVTARNAGTGPAAAPLSAQQLSVYAYALGIEISQVLSPIGDRIDFHSLEAGLRDGLDGAKPRLVQPDFAATLADVQTELDAATLTIAARNGADSAEFLIRNGRRHGVVTTASGLQYEIIQQGQGPRPKSSHLVTVNYNGRLISGEIFDNSHDKGKPVSFKPAQVIAGMREGILLMPVGSRFRLFVPPYLAYADRGAGTSIGPNQLLIFEVLLLRTK